MDTAPLVATSITWERLPHARALARTLAACHPEVRLTVLVVDDPDAAVSGAEEAFDLLHPADAAIGEAELHELALCCRPDELAAALAPALGTHLLRGAPGRPVVLLSPEAVVVAGLHPLLDRLGDAPVGGVVLVPRLLEPVPRDARRPSESEVDALGAFDPGIVAAVGDTGATFLVWWGEALRRAAFVEGRLPMDLAQPVLAEALGLFAAVVARHSGTGYAYWNAHERPLSRGADGQYLAGGETLRVAHLAGFDPWMPYVLSVGAGATPRVLLSEEPVLGSLCGEQADRLLAAGYPVVPSDPPAFSLLADGTPVDERMRRLARAALASAPRTGDVPPDPFAPGGPAGFYAWLASADPERTVGPTVPRYLLEVYSSRRDLSWNFPRLSTVDAVPFRNWVAFHGVDEEVPIALRPALEASDWWQSPTGVSAAGADGLKPGVTLTGYLRAEVGVGEAARLVLDALQGARLQVSSVAIDLPTSRQAHPFQSSPPIADRRVNVIWMNAEHLLGFAALVGPGYFEGRYTVGGWAWETEHLPAVMAANAELVDEIWVPSEYVRQAVEPAVDVPVRTFPHPVVPPPVDPAFRPGQLGIPDGFFFLYTFDFNSSFERKNPLGVLEAFTRAFAPCEGPTLVLKSVNGDRSGFECERLRAAAASRPDIVVIDAYVSASERGALLAACGCYVSLHRAEGFGLGMAEAMSLGRPVVATGYSGNLEFMDDKIAWLVPAKPVRVGPHAPPYDPEDLWGDPDLDAAAEMMRSVFADPSAALTRAERGQTRILAEHGRARAVRFLSERVAEIERLTEAGYMSSVAGALRRRLG